MTQLKGFKFVTILLLVFKKESKDKTKYEYFYSSLKAGNMKNGNDIADVFQSIYTINKTYKNLSEKL